MSKIIKFVIVLLAIVQVLNAQTYELVWSDEFDGTGAPDPEKWGYELGYQRNNKLQYYTNSTDNVRQFDGNLEITVREETISDFNYTSGSITTEGRKDWVYGKIEGRIKMPVGQGLWFVFWTLGTNIREVSWPRCGELDISEHINNEPYFHGTAHWANESGQHTSNSQISPVIDLTDWHVYSIVWNPDSIAWFVDDVQFHKISILDGVNSTHEFHAPHYILINQVIGGSWAGPPDETTPLPSTVFCDYIRVYQDTEISIPVTGVTLSPETINIGPGSTKQLKASIIPSNATDRAITFNSSNTDIVTVDTTGLITAVSEGTASITVTTHEGEFTATTEVEVASTEGINMVVNPGFEDDNGPTQTPTGWLEWSSTGHQNIIEVVSDNPHTGTYKNTQAGPATFDAYTFQKFTGLTNANYTLRAWVRSSGEQNTASMYVKNFGGDGINTGFNTEVSEWIQIEISDIPITNGECEIGFYQDGSAGHWIDIDDVELFHGELKDAIAVTDVSLNTSSTTVEVDSDIQLAASVTPNDASNQILFWSSSNADVAAVNKGGLVTGVAIGSAMISVRTIDGNFSASTEVSVIEATGVNTSGVLKNVTVYPTLLNGYIRISGLNIAAKLDIYDMTGSLISSHSVSNDQSIDLSSFAPGMYILHITEGQRRDIFKVLKQ